MTPWTCPLVRLSSDFLAFPNRVQKFCSHGARGVKFGGSSADRYFADRYFADHDSGDPDSAEEGNNVVRQSRARGSPASSPGPAVAAGIIVGMLAMVAI